MKRIQFVATLFATCLSMWPAVAGAQENMVTQGDSVVVGLPLAAFGLGDAPRQRTEFLSAAGRGLQNIKYAVPGDEDFDNWTTRLVTVIEEGRGGTLDAYIAEQRSEYVEACGQSPESGATFDRNEVRSVMLLACPAFLADPSKGEITGVMLIDWNGDYIRIEQKWRGAAFAQNDMESWPASNDEITAFVQALSQADFSRK